MPDSAGRYFSSLRLTPAGTESNFARREIFEEKSSLAEN
jgi:hypothetical protein